MRQLAALALLLNIASPTQAADLARQSALGAVFAERPARVIVRAEEPPPPSVIAIPLKVPGYYGGYDTPYRNYYGTSPVPIFSRLPYACKWHGLC